jgi:aldose 1-epimerase
MFSKREHRSSIQNTALPVPAVTIDLLPFGLLRGEPVPGFLLRNRHGVAATLVAYGARLNRLVLPDARGRAADIVLGFDTLAQYEASDAYMGATCGRYGSRISGGALALDGARYQLTCNEGRHHAHGGRDGFDRKLWHARADALTNEVVFTYVSPDGDEGYPGTLDAEVTYRLGDDNVLAIAMRAQCDRPTVVNLLHHTYWNLAGHHGGDVRAHRLSLDADAYAAIDDDLVPTGEVCRVEGTPFDFRTAKPIGRDLDAVPTATGGYDHPYFLRGAEGDMRRCATLEDPASGRALEIHSDAPGVQLYTGGHFRYPVAGKDGARYGQYAGVALETQRLPDAPKVGHFGSARLDPGDVYLHRMEIRLHSREPSDER